MRNRALGQGTPGTVVSFGPDGHTYLLIQPLDGRGRVRPLLFDIPCGLDVQRLLSRLGWPLVDVFVARGLDFRSCDSVDDGGVGACTGLAFFWRGILTVSNGATTDAFNRSSLSAILALRRLEIFRTQRNVRGIGFLWLRRVDGKPIALHTASFPSCQSWLSTGQLPSLYNL